MAQHALFSTKKMLVAVIALFDTNVFFVAIQLKKRIFSDHRIISRLDLFVFTLVNNCASKGKTKFVR